MSNSEKLKALKLTLDKIEKDYGKGSVMMMNEKGRRNLKQFQQVQLVSTVRWELADCQKEGSLKSMAQRALERPPLPPT